MFKIGILPQLNGDNQGQSDGFDSNWPDGGNQAQSDGFDSYGPAPVSADATGSNALSTDTGSSGAGGSNGAGSGGGSGGSPVTVSTPGSGLVFVNTYDNTCTLPYENCIVAAEETLETLFAPPHNPVTIDLDFHQATSGGPAYTVSFLDFFSYGQLKGALPASVDKDLPLTDPSPGGTDWALPTAYVRMLGLPNSSPTTIDGGVTVNSTILGDFGQDAVNAIEHELTEVGMGRIGSLGDQWSPYWSTMDLFRYSAAGTPDYMDGRDGETTYFFNGTTPSSSSVGLSFNNQFDGGGRFNYNDTADWTQEQVFGSALGSFTLVQTELNVMQALGWDPQIRENFWVGGSGNWSTVNATDWAAGSTDPDYVPITPQDAFIGTASSAAQVTSSSNETVNSIGTNVPSTLIIAGDSTFTATDGTDLNPADIGTTESGMLGTLEVDDGSNLVIGAPSLYSSPPTGPVTFDNAGTLTVGVSSGSGGNGNLEIDGSVTLNGSGTVNLGQYSNGTFSTGTVENFPSTNGALANVNNTITGGGTIGLYSFDNQALGTVEASQSQGSNLQVYGTNSFTNEDNMVAETGATLDLGQDGASGTLTDTGMINLDGNGDLAISGNFTITGSGDIGMTGAGADIVSDGAGATTFVNQSDIDASASGQIGDTGVLGVNDLTFDNGGTVLVSGSGNTLTLNTGGNTITETGGGMFLAENGAQMVIDSNVDAGGTIEATSGAEVAISAAIESGDQVLISGNGTIDLASGGSIASAITFSGSGGTLQVDNASDSVTGAISGFAAGDYIDARFMPFTSNVTAQWQENAGLTGGTLTLSNGSGTTMTFNLNGDYGVTNFNVYSDGSGGTQIGVQNAPPPGGTTAVMIMSEPSGDFTPSVNYEICDIGGNAMLAAYPAGEVASPWTFAGLSGFYGTDTSDLILRNTSTGALEIYDSSNNTITSAASLAVTYPMGTVASQWAVAGFGDLSRRAGETDMLMRATSGPDTADFELYDISNNQITNHGPMGAVGLEWTVAGFGDFSGKPGESDMIMRANSNSYAGDFEYYDISQNTITSVGPLAVTYPIGTASQWAVAGFGDFSSKPNETDMLLRYTGPVTANDGDFELYDIRNNTITASTPMGAVGLEWTVAGFGDFSGNVTNNIAETDMLMQNSNTGAFEVYDISDNAITFAGSMGSVPFPWQVDGIAPASPAGPSVAATAQLEQAMASFLPANSSSSGGAISGVDSQLPQLNLATPH